jgi:endonuclease/exonuclease/phosphatase family metal-dependent hydrolase
MDTPAASMRPGEAGEVVAKRPRSRVLTAIAWLLGALALASSTLWMIAGWSWWFDLAANLGAQMLLACVLIGLSQIAVRRWASLVPTVLACLLHLIPLASHRAAFWPRPVNDARAHAADEVRFLHYNDSTASDKRDVYGLIDREDADVTSIVCPPVHMQFDVINGHGLEDKYPGKLIRQYAPAPDGLNTLVTAAFVVSRWPLTRLDCGFCGPMSSRFIAGVVERPAGRFGIVAVHPRSPRWRERWEEGNSVSEALIAVVARLRSQGLPVVVLTDLNATPTGWRSRLVCSIADLRRAKPLLVLDGTYPDVVPWNLRNPQSKTGLPARWPASIAIDDALVTPDIAVTGWSVRTRLKSEHRPVRIDLRIPVPATSAANPGDR